MKTLLQRLLKVAAYAAAGIVILLAIAVGLFRLFLPRLPEYQEDIKAWASAAIGMDVEFTGMDARWGLSGPEVEFYNAELMSVDTATRIIAAEQVSIGVGLTRLLVDRKLVVDRVVVSDTSIEVRQLEDGQWWIQGSPLDELLPGRRNQRSGVGEIEFIGQDIRVLFLQPGDTRPREFAVRRAIVSRDSVRLAINANLDLPADLGGRLVLAATRLSDGPESRRWDVTVSIDSLELAGISALHSLPAAQFQAGVGDVDLSLSWAQDQVQDATADIDFRGVQIGEAAPLALSGLFEFRRDANGWLLASTGYQLETERGPWPRSTVRLETGTDDAGGIVMADFEASYLRLADFRIVFPWLSMERRDLISGYAPDGELRDLAVQLSDIDSDARRFDVSAELAGIGVAPVDGRPGVRGFSGRLRADNAGGRLEIDSPGMALTVPKFLGDVAYLDEASGTLIWRRGDNRTTLLSDSIVLRNADFDVKANIEITQGADSSAPIVDLAATWSINDLAEAKRYIPFIPRIPNTSAWFQEGIKAGRIPNGTARLYGPMDKWPFDGGEGRLLIEATVENARINYLKRWPDAEIIDLDIAVENMRLYSNRNHIITAGNEVFNANFELSDFRLPILTLKTYSTGKLDSVRGLIAQSPLGSDVFGGKLDEIEVSGDGAFSLDLTVPVRNTEALEFTSKLQTSNAGLIVEGFPAPITELSGVVTIRKDDIDSEALGGMLLGRPVAIQLQNAPASMADYRIVASANGGAAAENLVSELGIPLEGRLDGELAYTARLLFPRGQAETPSPFAIEVESDLAGLGIDLPEPLGKAADTELPTELRIELPAGSERIDSSGRAAGLLGWDVSFARSEERWDIDRGVVSFGATPADPGETGAEPTETRGLHLRGATERVRFQDWLDLSKDERAQGGMAERIRSIDMTIANLHIIGQHLVDHQVRVDRSARDWLVQVDGEEVVGSVIVPYDFRSGRELVLDMERLVLPGDDTETGPAKGVDAIDPRTLPPISVKAREFAFGDRFLGAVEAVFRHTADGLVADNIVATDDSFDISGSARWVIDESDPLGHRSSVTAALTSKDVKRTMQRLNYEPGIESDELSMQLDFSWSGGPREDFLASLDGEVKLRIGSGQLDTVDPGAGRMFGLMSIAALPRRLALDFRDVFGKGFGFDKISGDFRIDDGETYTCNLSLEGPAADIAVVGRAGLVARDYDQVAIVSASFGNTLPVVGGVLGGPQVAAVMLIFSQIFKKPLQEVTQIYYGVSGSFDDPLIDNTTAEQFAAKAAEAGCIELTE